MQPIGCALKYEAILRQMQLLGCVKLMAGYRRVRGERHTYSRRLMWYKNMPNPEEFL